MRMTMLVVAAALLTGGCGGGQTGEILAQEDHWADVSVMTRNVYYGADLGEAITAVLLEDPEAIVTAVSGVWAQLEATDYRARARAMAVEIDAVRPDLIGVQEAALWRTQYPSDTFTEAPTAAEDVAYDLLAILLEELAALGLDYDVVVTLETIDAELPRLNDDYELEDLRFTDREAILVRRDADLALDDPQGAWFDAILVLPNGLPIPQGWVSVEATKGASTFRFVSTHLEADVQELRVAQAAELLAGPTDTDLPVVLVGDFNSDASPGNVDAPAFDLLVDGGLEYVTPTPRPAGTCCYDDVLAPVDPEGLDQQIDLVFTRDGAGIAFVQSAWQAVGPTLAATPEALWSSDHAGVAVTLAWKP